MSHKIEKTIAELTLADLKTIPIWRIVHQNGRDVVEPTTLKEYPDDEMRPGETDVFIVSTKFITANGKAFYGYCSPWDPSGIDYTRPVIILEAQQVPLFGDRDISPADIALRMRMLQDQLFPLKFETLVKAVDGSIYAHTIVLDDYEEL